MIARIACSAALGAALAFGFTLLARAAESAVLALAFFPDVL
jgi:hypothetical protein